MVKKKSKAKNAKKTKNTANLKKRSLVEIANKVINTND